jgi:hypothetical protein
MKAKEKAEQLVNSFYYALPNNGRRTGLNSTTARYKEATVCALIAVDEIIKAINFDWMEVQNLESEHRYWQGVKEEIELIGDDKGV